MVRAPCCEKMGLKKGPWTSEEDQILINFIRVYGHGNWRALPRLAGLLRCGKSCRLRWTNYLRPDIKRGNFSRDEEDTIIKLHELLGNRWSAIASKLPGRTDNEIKNMWHTHLKKRVKQSHESPEHNYKMEKISKFEKIYRSASPRECPSDISNTFETPQNLLEIDQNFRSEVFSEKKFRSDFPFDYVYDSMDFWNNLLTKVGELPEI